MWLISFITFGQSLCTCVWKLSLHSIGFGQHCIDKYSIQQIPRHITLCPSHKSLNCDKWGDGCHLPGASATSRLAAIAFRSRFPAVRATALKAAEPSQNRSGSATSSSKVKPNRSCNKSRKRIKLECEKDTDLVANYMVMGIAQIWVLSERYELDIIIKMRASSNGNIIFLKY